MVKNWLFCVGLGDPKSMSTFFWELLDSCCAAESIALHEHNLTNTKKIDRNKR